MKEKKCYLKNYKWMMLLAICIAALFLAEPVHAEEGDGGYREGSGQQEQESGSGQQEQEGRVNGLSAESQTVRSIRLKWESVEGAQGYTLYQRKDKSKKWKKVRDLQQNFYAVRKLKPATIYRFRVAAYKDGASGREYWPVSETLVTATVPEKTSIKVTQAGFYLADYHLRLLICRAKKVKGASGYQYAYSRFRNGKYKTSRRKKWIQKLRLQVGRVYYFKVRAYKKVGDTYYYGEYSDPEAVRIK